MHLLSLITVFLLQFYMHSRILGHGSKQSKYFLTLMTLERHELTRHYSSVGLSKIYRLNENVNAIPVSCWAP